ncbi:hypothetical protein H5410_013702 [Solanum commersonii]|uniref:Uncharacterized protein n=1 Tax=Solanum commersonii TaxID=4109 RepID=A0A9J5ZNY8_SOLCO|nr:hypothetical protein H5410_013702 [Solanum commersonii]
MEATFDLKLKWKWKLINFMGIQRGIVVSLMLENLACKHITIGPTPQDVLIEERDWNQTNTYYSGMSISCEDHLQDDYCGIYGQLRGWWDNYMPHGAETSHDNLGFALVQNREGVYKLILTILEHFSGRFTNQYETIRSLLNGLKCRHLGIIPYSEFTYGKLIGACMRKEGINLCNELKLSRRLKMDKLREKSHHKKEDLEEGLEKKEMAVFSCFMLSVETHDVCNTIYTDSGYVMVADILYGSRSTPLVGLHGVYIVVIVDIPTCSIPDGECWSWSRTQWKVTIYPVKQSRCAQVGLNIIVIAIFMPLVSFFQSGEVCRPKEQMNGVKAMWLRAASLQRWTLKSKKVVFV